MNVNLTIDSVKDYYGNTLQGSKDLKTDACCTPDNIPVHLKTAMAKIHPEVASHYYGCGLVAPQKLMGMKILDLGSGSGRDCYLLANLVGENGFILGVDMTDEQLTIANKHLDYHQQAFAYQKSNVEFRKGYIEKLDELNLEDNSFDIIVSNCVINLSPDKEAVLAQAFRLLKPGGELYFSDVYADRRVPADLLKDPVLYGECLAGALYWNDFLNIAKKAGFTDPRLVEDRPLLIDNPEIEAKIGHINFYSATYRLFKLADLDASCEDYGQAIRYKGGIEDSERAFLLDKHHLFEKGRIMPVCDNTFKMLAESRFNPHFDFFGDTSTHYGLFTDCGERIPFDSKKVDITQSDGGSCC